MNNKAYAEVYQIIQYLPEKEYRRIPFEQIKYLEKNMDLNTPKICTATTNIEQIELSLEAQKILLNLFYNYIANNEQKIKLKNILLQKEKYVSKSEYNKIFENEQTIINQTTTDIKNKQITSISVTPKKTLFIKIKNIFLNLINKIKNKRK